MSQRSTDPHSAGYRESLHLRLSPDKLGFTVGDQELRALLLFWFEPTVDATVLAYHSLSAVDSLLDQPDGVFEAYVAEPRITESLRSFLTDLYDREIHAFKNSRSSIAWPSLYSTYYALALIEVVKGKFPKAKGWDLVNRELTELLGEGTDLDIIRFTHHCQRESQGFAHYPGGEPSLISDEIAFRILTKLKAPAQDLGRAELEITRHVRSSMRHRREGDAAIVCYDDVSEGTGWGGLSHRYIAALNQLWGFLGPEDIEASLRYIQRCRNSDGGFAAEPGQVSTIVSTRHHIDAYRRYLSSESGRWTEQLEEWAPGLKDYLLLWADHVAQGSGLGFTPDSPPNLLAIRDALDLLRTLQRQAGVAVYERQDLLMLRDAVLRQFRSGEGLFTGYSRRAAAEDASGGSDR